MIQLTFKITTSNLKNGSRWCILDVDGLAEVDLGNGTNYNPAGSIKYVFPNWFYSW